MLNLSEKSIQELIDPKGFDCECGRHHGVSIRYIRTGRGILGNVVEMVRALDCRKPFVLCDRNTYRAAGERVCGYLKDAGMEYTLHVVDADKPSPDEHMVGNVLMHLDPSCDLLLGVGGGVINDTCKEVAFKTGRMNAIVGTAPSMDGYASGTSSMELDGVKLTLNNQCPQGILLDADILAQAPIRMLWAGYGDMIAKYVAICEWRIAHLVIDEYYCETVADMMRTALKRVADNAEKLAQRDPDAVLAVADGLILAGLGMAFAEFSRPASGLEHYFSHMWEMMAMERHKPYDLHGIQVGIGTVLTLKLYDYIRTLTPDRARMEAHAAAFDEAAWEKQVRSIFGRTGEEILRIESRVHKNDPERLRKRIDALERHWGEILRIIDEELPDSEEILSVMRRLGMPVKPSDIGISDEDTVNAYLGARDIRDKYLSCSFLWDLGYEREAAEEVRKILQTL